MKKQPLLIKFDLEQVEHLNKQANKSEYLRKLVMTDIHKETRQMYVFGLISQMCIKDISRIPETELISRLSRMLAKSVSGQDVIAEIMERIAE